METQKTKTKYILCLILFSLVLMLHPVAFLCFLVADFINIYVQSSYIFATLLCVKQEGVKQSVESK